MNNLLIDLDSKIPNLALMQLSTYLKSKGEDVEFRVAENHVDRVWISCIFTWNAAKAKGLARFWEAAGAEPNIGGTGVDFTQVQNRLVQLNNSQLPLAAQSCLPDYSLYPDDDRAVGFVARGCNRGCEFCVVPMKEGKIGPAWPIHEWNQGRSKILLLDNDLPLGPHHDTVLQECIEFGFRLSITQGYDLRCVARGEVSHDGLSMLVENKPWDLKFRERRLYVAWDYLGIEPYVRRGIEILLDYGFRPRELMCYILCGFNTTPDEDLYRYRILWDEYGVYPFVMVYNNRRDNGELRAFARWVNRRIHKISPWEDYNRRPT